MARGKTTTSVDPFREEKERDTRKEKKRKLDIKKLREWEEGRARWLKAKERARKEEDERSKRREEEEIKLALEGIARREAVNHPPHYNQGNIEVIDAIEDWGLDFNSGNVVKYVARHQHKAEPLEDLKKARWYLDRIIKGIENGSIEDQ